MPTVQFSLTGSLTEILESFAEPGESLNLTAKRVLTTFLLGIPNQGKAEQNRAIELDHGDVQRKIDKIEALIDSDDEDLDLTSTDWHLHCLDARIKAIEIAIEADHYPNQDELTNRSQTLAGLEERIEKLEIAKAGTEEEIEKLWICLKLTDCSLTNRIESIEEGINKLDTEIETLTTLSKQQTTPNHGGSIIFLADAEENPLQFWTGQVWTDDLNLAYRYKSTQALSRAVDKLKKRKPPGEGLPGTTIACAPIEKLLENGES